MFTLIIRQYPAVTLSANEHLLAIFAGFLKVPDKGIKALMGAQNDTHHEKTGLKSLSYS